MDYGNTKIPSMHRSLGSATLSQLAFPREGNPDYPWEKSHWDSTVVKIKSKVKVIFIVSVAVLPQECSCALLVPV